MNKPFSKRMDTAKVSFIREIFNIIKDPKIISFAGGLPNPKYFPRKAIQKATLEVLNEDPNTILQYSVTEGFLPLRKFISGQYKKKEELAIDPNEILITNGSQQGIDMLGKLFIDEDDIIIVEDPTYLAAVQSFGFYMPNFKTLPMLDDGPDIKILKEIVATSNPKFFYTVPNFQNPTGITCSKEKREQIVKILSEKKIPIIEDDPYGEIRFSGDRQSSYRTLYKNTILLGSFSKTVAPGLRLGWISAPKEIYDKLYIIKQGSDLHTGNLNQHIITRYFKDNDSDIHIKKIADAYKQQKEVMIEALKKYLPKDITFTDPDGGMFLWLTFPKKIDTLKLFHIAIKEGVAFVPGAPFFANDAEKNTARFNYTNSTSEEIEEGVQRLLKAYNKYTK